MGSFQILRCSQSNLSKYIRQACENLATQGRKLYDREVFKIIKIPTWNWWPLLIQILPVIKVVTAAFHIKNVARNHVNSSFLQRLPKLVWWHFLGLNNNDKTNNSVNSKKSTHYFCLPKILSLRSPNRPHTYFPCEGNICISKNPSMKPWLGAGTGSIRHMEFSNARWIWDRS